MGIFNASRICLPMRRRASPVESERLSFLSLDVRSFTLQQADREGDVHCDVNTWDAEFALFGPHLNVPFGEVEGQLATPDFPTPVGSKVNVVRQRRSAR